MSFLTNSSVNMFQNLELNRQHKRIQNLIEQAKSRFEPDDELQSHLAKYICVVCSGFLENAMFQILNDKVCRETECEVLLSYMKVHLLKIQNPNSNKIREVVKSFSLEWHDKLSEFLREEDRASAINYIITDRHNIAHGKDSEITIGKIEVYFKRIVDVFSFMENLLVLQPPLVEASSDILVGPPTKDTFTRLNRKMV
ncbi:HEPN domain-containing protein [Pedobacter sp. P351]|uniref:HEPN domain-containing protein n=1 Tax=Pedobacter superstes TaxID=3133441 RepID=UPI0030A56CD3